MKQHLSRASRNAAKTALGSMLKSKADRDANLRMVAFWLGRDRQAAKKA